MHEIWQGIIEYASQIDFLELLGLVFGVLCVWFLIKQNILTWPAGIIYVLISFVIFWKARLYGDFFLHIFFLVLNIYGWYYWVYGKQKEDEDVPVTTLTIRYNLIIFSLTALGVLLFGYFLQSLPNWIDGIDPAALPYWDATTSILSVTGMWLTTRKKLENWYYWLTVDILATGIYIYKGIYFYAALYFIYIFLAVGGFIEWYKSYKKLEV